jgi:hypothetical protein
VELLVHPSHTKAKPKTQKEGQIQASKLPNPKSFFLYFKKINNNLHFFFRSEEYPVYRNSG